MKTQLDKHTGLIYGPEDLQMRLNKSLIRYKGRPFYVNDTAGAALFGIFTDTGDGKDVALPDKDLDVRPVPLGYVNTPKGSVYCTRQPHRRYKQGLCADSLTFEGKYSPRELLTSKPLAACVMNEYPSFKEAHDSVKKGKGALAFSRRFCVERDDSGVMFLQYRGSNVGWINKGVPELGESHHYLAEELAIAIGGKV